MASDLWPLCTSRKWDKLVSFSQQKFSYFCTSKASREQQKLKHFFDISSCGRQRGSIFRSLTYFRASTARDVCFSLRSQGWRRGLWERKLNSSFTPIRNSICTSSIYRKLICGIINDYFSILVVVKRVSLFSLGERCFVQTCNKSRFGKHFTTDRKSVV